MESTMASAANVDNDISTTVNNECLVCTDKATGLHYSVNTCEGCKGFFKRTVQKQLKYTCRGLDQLGGCFVTKENRNNCQHCRYKKCLNVGMRVDAVREDRTPGGRPQVKKQKVESSSLLSEDNDHQDKPDMGCVNKLPDVSSGSSLDSMSQDDSCSQAKNEDLMQLLEDLKATRPDVIPEASESCSEVQPGDELKATNNVDPNQFMQCAYKELQLIIRWAKKVPGFRQLGINDQMCLLKGSFMELNILRLAYRSRKCFTDELTFFGHGLILTEDQITSMGWDRDFVQATLMYSKRLSEIGVDYSEFCLLNALVLSFPDAGGLQNKEATEKLQTHFMDCFFMYCQIKQPQDTKRYGQMLLGLQTLRVLSAKAADCFFQLIDNGLVPKDALAQEMFVDGFTSL